MLKFKKIFTDQRNDHVNSMFYRISIYAPAEVDIPHTPYLQLEEWGAKYVDDWSSSWRAERYGSDALAIRDAISKIDSYTFPTT